MPQLPNRPLQLTSAAGRPLRGLPMALAAERLYVGRTADRHARLPVSYTKAEHEAGWELLHRVSGFKKPLPVVSASKGHVREAMVRLDGLDEGTLERVEAPLKRLHPEQHAFVCDGLAAAQGAGSVLTMKLLCDRLDALEGAPEREATRAADHAALATLEARGITKPFRAEVRGLVEIASSLSDSPPPPPAPSFPNAQQLEELNALRKWYVDWSQTARAVIVRRDWLIRLGLAKRKKSARRDEQPGAAAVQASGTE